MAFAAAEKRAPRIIARKFMDSSSVVLDLKFLYELAATIGGTSNQPHSLRVLSSDRVAQFVGQIGFLPRKAAIIVRRTAEMTIRRRAGVDRPAQLQMLADAARR